MIRFEGQIVSFKLNDNGCYSGEVWLTSDDEKVESIEFETEILDVETYNILKLNDIVQILNKQIIGIFEFDKKALSKIRFIKIKK